MTVGVRRQIVEILEEGHYDDDNCVFCRNGFSSTSASWPNPHMGEDITYPTILAGGVIV